VCVCVRVCIYIYIYIGISDLECGLVLNLLVSRVWKDIKGLHGTVVQLVSVRSKCMSYEEEDTCMSYEEEDTCVRPKCI
jgi:hypothetical protein